MKKLFITLLAAIFFTLASKKIQAQSLKVGVFDIDLMVQAMPGYRVVDSLVQKYEVDSLAIEFQYYQSEFQRLDSTYKVDSALVALGKKSKALLDFTAQERRKMGLNLLYWQQIAQDKSNNKRNQYAQPLYNTVASAYKKVLARNKYALILKPQTYEAGVAIDNLFISVAKELGLPGLPQELIYLGDNPDVAKQQVNKPATGNKPKNK
jgi:Skp family chaperone for outer membrane proteins